MRIGRWKRVVSALLAVWLLGSPMVGAAAAAGRPEASGMTPSAEPATAAESETSAAAAADGCPSTQSCGSDCTAELVTGFCAVVVSWTGGASVGGIQIGPRLRVTCDVCECWYTYTSSTGFKTFKRTTKLGCSAGSPDIHVE
ncbi:MAG: hypothetical protein R3195_07580 [Gemmatimonadota bacterium]|nr:hypothetical protein [Gemmatimonadota bacterium]